MPSMALKGFGIPCLRGQEEDVGQLHGTRYPSENQLLK
jgi:hypothetical protein